MQNYIEHSLEFFFIPLVANRGSCNLPVCPSVCNRYHFRSIPHAPLNKTGWVPFFRFNIVRRLTELLPLVQIFQCYLFRIVSWHIWCLFLVIHPPIGKRYYAMALSVRGFRTIALECFHIFA